MANNFRTPTFFLSSLVLFSYSLIVFSNAANTIKQGQSIGDGETVISSGENFVLGFFSPENSTNRYVGIWYNKVSIQTVVWVANRENPISDTTGVLTIGEDGNLVVLNGSRNPIWSTNASISSNTTATLMDSGNLVLASSDNMTHPGIWESFEYPTDTFLPGMRVTDKHIFVSWKSANDPAKGNYSMGVDLQGSLQIVIWEGSKRIWRSGQWNGLTFAGVPNTRALYLYGFKVTNDEREGKMYLTYTMLNSSENLKFRINWNGSEEQRSWDEERKEWSLVMSQPSNKCEVYNKCGNFGSCSITDSPICICVEGFKPKFIEEWNRGNWSGGCVRKTQLQCQRNSSVEAAKEDGFLKFKRMKLPDFGDSVTVQDTDECEAECLKNCSCGAYAYVIGMGCMIWGRDLVDLQHFQQFGSSLFIRLADSELGGNRKISKILIIVFTVLGTTFLSIFIWLLWRFRAKIRNPWKKGSKEQSLFVLSKSREFSSHFSGPDDLVREGNQDNGPELPLFHFNTVAVATNNFSDENKLGEGGFGAVYKGQLPSGQEIAVKRLSRKSGQGVEEFKNEIIMIAKLQHRNLVRLLGCCIQGEEKMLLYEYMPNKSLDSFLFDPTKKGQLDWKKRFNIIEGIARGLLYLHRDSRLRIIHRDLKAGNILLDEEMNPKISDFGMARIFGGNQNQANTNRVVGTYGYMSPEYAMEGLFSVKSDVYSFGVLLLEILSGQKNTSFRHPQHSSNLIGYAWNLWNEGKAMEFMDTSISFSEFEVLRCIHVALLCVQDSAMERPTMSSVILMLESETASLPRPKQPTFTIVRNHTEMDLCTESPEIVSANDVTVTMVFGR